MTRPKRSEISLLASRKQVVPERLFVVIKKHRESEWMQDK